VNAADNGADPCRARARTCVWPQASRSAIPMPEYHNLQAFARYHAETFNEDLSRYRSVLQTIGCYDQSVEAWLTGIAWDVAENGFVYTGCHDPWVEFESAGMRLKAGPHVIGFTPQAYPSADAPWIEFGLLFETQDLQTGASFSTWEYRPKIGSAIWNLMKHFGPAFSEVGVFLTDEAQDGQPLQGIVEDTDARWEFDLAWIPDSNARLFPPAADGFIRHRVPGATGVARRGVWTAPPWHAPSTPA
jgi:hypothetical protein